MKNTRFILMRSILPAIISFFLIQDIKSQTFFRLNVSQPEELIVDAGSDVSIDVGNNTILGGSPTALGGTGNLTYLWTAAVYLDDETLPNPTAQPPGNLTFNVTVADERGCTADDEIVVTVIGGTNLTEAEENAALNIYPNPTSGLFTICLREINSTEFQILLINMSGIVILQKIIQCHGSSVSTDLDISGMSKGAYFLRINGDNESIHRQIILK
jgi:hypothetical protein